MPDTLLVLGTSPTHTEVIRAARDLKLRVVTMAARSDAPVHARADVAYAADPTDPTAVEQLATREQAKGIINAGGDACVMSCLQAAAKLSLPGLSLEAAKVLCDKPLFREFVTELGLPHPQTHRLKASGIPPAETIKGHQWVLKPDRATDGNVVFIINDAEQLAARLPEVLAQSTGGIALLERYFVGNPGLCTGVVSGGQVAGSWLMDRYLGDEPSVVTTSLRLPTRLPQHLRKQLAQALEKVFTTLRVSDCVFDASYVVGDGKAHILSIAPRLPGCGGAQVLRAAGGPDLARLAVLQACGMPITFSDSANLKPTAVVMLGTASAGRLAFDPKAAESFADIPWVSDVVWDIRRGAHVEPFTRADRRVGQLLVHAQDRDQLDARVGELLRRLRLRAE